MALVGISPAGSATKPKSTIHVYNGEFSVGIGDFETQALGCGSGERVLGGGYKITGGNFAYVLGAYPATKENKYVVGVLVPNSFAEPGVLPATFRVRIICVEKGKAIVG